MSTITINAPTFPVQGILRWFGPPVNMVRDEFSQSIILRLVDADLKVNVCVIS